MYHAQCVSNNWFTGRKVWLLRELLGSRFGDPWQSSLVVIQAHYLCRDAELLLLEGLSETRQFRKLRDRLKLLGFKVAHASRHGRIKCYPVA